MNKRDALIRNKNNYKNIKIILSIYFTINKICIGDGVAEGPSTTPVQNLGRRWNFSSDKSRCPERSAVILTIFLNVFKHTVPSHTLKNHPMA